VSLGGPALSADAPTDQRTRILDAALRLMGDQGVAGASMRQLATACGLNVATLYHYFPSKSDLLRSVVEDRRYLDRLALDEPLIERAAPAQARLAQLVTWLWERTAEEVAVLRLLLGEGIRGEEVAADAAGELLEALDRAVARWLAEHVPELGDRVDAAARLVGDQIVALAVEHLALGTPVASASARATDLAGLLLPDQ
jgi:AcrR family transcriptional regulator